MKKIKIIFLTLLVFVCSKFYGQDTTGVINKPIIVSSAMPVSWIYLDTAMFSYTDSSTTFNPNPTTGSNFRQALNTYSLPTLSNTTLQNYADSVQNSCTVCGYSKAYGYGIENVVNLKSTAQYYNPHIAGGKLWIMRMSSATALSLQFYFSKFMVPNNSFLYIYTADRSKILGPYTSDNTPADSTKAIHFGTVPINANDVYFEYYESDTTNFTGNITVANTIHVYSGSGSNYGSSASCHDDVACDHTWDSQTASVALILMYNSASKLAGSCTGTLLNNTSQNGAPYFLTAAHCLADLNSGYGTSSWNFVFDYQNPCCGGNNGIDPGFGSKVVYGADVLAIDQINSSCTSSGFKPNTSDYLLLNMYTDAAQLSQWGVCYSGWDANPGKQPEEYGLYTTIHHPAGDVMKISQSEGLYCPFYDVNGGYSTQSGCPDPNNYICRCPDPTYNTCSMNEQYFYTTDFIAGGTTEPGSSGAPLFEDATKNLIGTVTGAQPLYPSTHISTDYCTNSNANYYARFNEQYPNFIDPTQTTPTNYLDPGHTFGPNPVNISCAAWCPPNSNAPNLVQCTSSGGNGGTPTSNCAGFPRSVLINGLDGIPVLCNQNNFSIITIGNDLYFDLSSQHTTSCSQINANVGSGVYNVYSMSGAPGVFAGIRQNPPPWGNTNTPGFSPGCCNAGGGGCEYYYGAYNIYVVKMDFNLNAVQSWGKTYQINSYDVDYLDMTHCCTFMWGVHKIGFKPSDLGVTLQPGNFYTIGIQTNNELNGCSNGKYLTSSRMVYIMPDGNDSSIPGSGDYTATNTTLGDVVNWWDYRNIYANQDIYLDETTVLPNILNLAAGFSIRVTASAGSSDLKGGHYFIKPDNDLCNHASPTGRVKNPNQPDRGGITPNPNNNVVTTVNNNIPKSTYYQNTSVGDYNLKSNPPSFTIYPNPANNNAIVEFTDDVPKTNTPVSVSIYNSIGEIVNAETVILFQKYMNLNVGTLSPGLYNVIITQGSKKWQSKVVKQ